MMTRGVATTLRPVDRQETRTVTGVEAAAETDIGIGLCTAVRDAIVAVEAGSVTETETVGKAVILAGMRSVKRRGMRVPDIAEGSHGRDLVDETNCTVF
jgi:hypothetical protein